PPTPPPYPTRRSSDLSRSSTQSTARPTGAAIASGQSPRAAASTATTPQPDGIARRVTVVAWENPVVRMSEYITATTIIQPDWVRDRKSTRLNSSHQII